jgi:hypothetical protein
MKEGPAEDYANKERIAGLLRFVSTHNEKDEQTVSLADYVGRMQEGQEKIYYITADSPAAARYSPHLEVLKKKGIEVLLLSDRVDEWLVTSLLEFDGKPLQSVAKGELDLGELEDKAEKESSEKATEAHKDLLERMQGVLGETVKEVRVSHRLTDSPACLVVEEHDMSANLARVLKSVGQDAPQSKPIMEINISHPLLERLEKEAEEGRFSDLTKVLFDQAQLAEGGQLDDPAAFDHAAGRYDNCGSLGEIERLRRLPAAHEIDVPENVPALGFGQSVILVMFAVNFRGVDRHRTVEIGGHVGDPALAYELGDKVEYRCRPAYGKRGDHNDAFSLYRAVDDIGQLVLRVLVAVETVAVC